MNPPSMFANRYRTRQSRKRNHADLDQNMASIDRLSNLPDGVICHILSFLPTKLSVATSILAKRWRFMWAYVPTLDFNIGDHNSETSFSSIINRVMLLRRVQTINTFRFSCDGFDCSEYEIETWIITAVERDVQKLDLDLQPEIIFMLPPCIFTCKTLVELTLSFCALPPLNRYTSLPSLKKLHLHAVEYVVDESLPHLLSSCPVLEDLFIDGLLDDNLDCFNISSPTIEWLRVKFPNNGMEESRHNCMVEINAPALEYLKIVDCVSTCISARALTSLIEADIYLDYATHDEDDYYFVSVLSFVDSLSNVTRLRLSSDLVFSLESESTVRFHNLTYLELAGDWLFLMKFLESADNLKVLVIHEVDECQKRWVEPEQVPTCLLSHLETVGIDQFEYTEAELNMARYLLMNAKVLKRMEICSPDDCKAKSDALQSFQRGSEACELALY